MIGKVTHLWVYEVPQVTVGMHGLPLSIASDQIPITEFQYLLMPILFPYKLMTQYRARMQVKAMVCRPPRASSLQQSTSQVCMVAGWKPPGGLSDHEEPNSLVWWDKDWSVGVMFGGKQDGGSSPGHHRPYSQACWWQRQAEGLVFSNSYWETGQYGTGAACWAF